MEITDFLGGAGACMLVCVCMCVCVCLGGCVRFQSAVANLSEGGSFSRIAFARWMSRYRWDLME
jgi:hypothetical protein